MRHVPPQPSHFLCFLLLLFRLPAPAAHAAVPSPESLSAFDLYTRDAEQRLDRQHRSSEHFLVATALPSARTLRKDEIILEDLSPLPGSAPAPAIGPDASLHHWRATAFVPGVFAETLDHLLRNVDRYPEVYKPQVVRAAELGYDRDDRQETRLLLRQKTLLTVVLQSDYQVQFGRTDPRHRYSSARSTRIAEVENVGTAAEHTLSDAESHGFLWRQNTYWSYAERDGGLYLQVESVSLTRSVPIGLGWAVNPLVRSVPRASLEFLLRATCHALTQHAPGGAA